MTKRVKIFSKKDFDSAVDAAGRVEDQMNSWLAETGVSEFQVQAVDQAKHDWAHCVCYVCTVVVVY